MSRMLSIKDRIDPGSLDRGLIFRKYATIINADTKSETRGAATEYVIKGSVIEPNQSKEVNQADATMYKRVLNVVVRYRAWLKSDFSALELVVEYDGEEYEIDSIREMSSAGRRMFMVIKCVQYV